MSTTIQTAATETELVIAELDDSASAELAAAALDKVRLWNELGRELKAKLEAAMIRFIQANGEVTIGPVRYYVGTKKTTKCLDNGEAVKSMLELGGVELLRDVLSSSAFKHGAARKRLAELGCEDVYDRLFETSEEQELKDGKAVKTVSLLSFDERFKR